MTTTTEENNPEGSRVVAMLEIIMQDNPRQDVLQRQEQDQQDILLHQKDISTSSLTLVSDLEDLCTEIIKDLSTQLRLGFAMIESILMALTVSQEKIANVDKRLQTVETQVPAVEQRVHNVEKVRKDEKMGQVTHLGD